MSLEGSSTPDTSSVELNASEKANDNGQKTTRRALASWNPWNVALFLISFRILNALAVRTFFQPDEYYQALEPAWRLAFGPDSGAWITWEWQERLRSAIHPSLFATVYQIAANFADLLHLGHNTRAEILLAGPKVVQALIAAVGDFYTWKLAKQVYGTESREASTALALTVLSPWQWFCSTRTFSNCLESTLTVVALCYWPYHWALTNEKEKTQVDRRSLRIRESNGASVRPTDETTKLRRAIIFASVATILRPTNALIWISLIVLTFTPLTISQSELTAFLTEALTCGSLVLGLSVLIDRVFYGIWTLPPVNFLKFNVVQSVAVFYGNNDWHYYLSQGYPLSLIGALPFGLLGICRALSKSSQLHQFSQQTRTILYHLAIVAVVLPAALSVLSHKEVRFIYPLLPALHVLAAHPLTDFAQKAGFFEHRSQGRSTSTFNLSKITLFSLLTVNIIVAGYVSFVHNSGINALPEYFRTQFENFYLPTDPPVAGVQQRNLTFALFMPCHSTPWRSHLQYPPTSSHPGISGWALTCEPPLNMDVKEKLTYLDEADLFYADPSTWIKQHMSLKLPKSLETQPGVFVKRERKKLWGEVFDKDVRSELWLQQGDGGKVANERRSWPEYLAFFQQLEPVLESSLRGSGYKECARFFNSHFHDDWRRRGDVVVWCLHPERNSTEVHSVNSFWNNLFGWHSTRSPTQREVEDALHGSKPGAQEILR